MKKHWEDRILAQGLQGADLRQEFEAGKRLVRKGSQEAKGRSRMS